MRNFEEKRNEIFLRSRKKIIYEKQKRRKILLASSASVICIAAVLALSLPVMLKEHKGENEKPSFSTSAVALFSSAEIESFSGDFKARITDSADAEAKFRLLEDMFRLKSENTVYTEESTDPDDFFEKGTSYYITFAMSNGEKTRFLLSDDILASFSDNESVRLQNKNLEKLKKEFNLPD